MTWVHKANLKGIPGTNGAAGSQGAKGDRGAKGLTGSTGPANQLTIGGVDIGTSASAALTGSAPAQQLHLTIPRGPQGIPGTGAVPADAAVAGYIGTAGTSDTKTALLAAIADALAVVTAPAPSGGNDTAMLNALLAANAGKAVSLRAGRTYIVTDTIVVPTKTVLLGNMATLDCTGIPDGTALSQRFGITTEGSLGAEVLVDDPIVKWGKVVTGVTDTAGLAPGDMVLLSSDERPVPGMTRTDRDKGEINLIKSIDSPTQVTLMYGALFDYGSTDLSFRTIDPVQNVTVESLNLIMGGVGSAHNGIQARYGQDITFSRVHVTGAEDVALGLKTVLNGKISDCTARESTSSLTLGDTGYGVCIWDGSRHATVEGNYFYDNRHHIAGGGLYPPAFVDVLDNHGQRASSAAYDCHESTFYWTFKGNTTEGSTHGFYLRGQYITMDSNTISDCTAETIAVHTFDGVTEQRGIRLINNTGTHTAFGISIGKTGSEVVEYLSIDVEIVGNTLNDCGTNPIRLRYFDGAKVTGNTVIGSTGHAIRIEGLTDLLPSKNLTIGANDVRDAQWNGVDLKFIDDINMVGGLMENCGQYAVQLTTCNRSALSTVQGRVMGFGGIYIEGGAIHTVANCMMSGSTNAAIADGVRINNSADASVLGGIYAQARWGVYSSLTDGVIVQGVNVRNSGSKIKVDDAATQSVANNII